MWHTYIVKCADGTFYTGITTDVARRIDEHNTSPKSAKYTRGRRPVELVYFKKTKTKSAASKEEHRIKRLTRKEKTDFIQLAQPSRPRNKRPYRTSATGSNDERKR